MTEENEGSMTYVARKECGCLTLLVIDTPNMVHRKDMAKEISAAILRGDTIERVATEEVRKMDWKCPKHQVIERIKKAQLPLVEV